MVYVWRTMDTTFRGRGNGYKSIAMIAVIAGVYVSIVSVLRFGHFLAGFNTSPSSNNDLLPTVSRIHFRIVTNWTLASCYLYLPSIIEIGIERIGNLCGLPDCYFKFTRIVLLSSILNEVPEICLWNLNKNYAENIHFYLHCSMWIISFMIMLAIDVTEITGLKPIFYYHLMNENVCSLKSQQFHRFLSNMGFPGSSCLLIILWSQKLMSFDRLLLAVIWTLGILSCNQSDDKDIKYVARQIEKKKAWMYYSEKISVSPLK
ncbi:nurim homolog isoform X2 [Melanaphis sacchari]|uniref:Nuclear envelope membrane protein n=1 Tax=Melanaphis sacchari TaxID=742174 RepID=A0A2H8TTX4_9HEMI|nr:nurim homolog isoform X2 [Melanaphis sacchari]